MGNSKIYLAGPMSGYPEYNFPAFFSYQGYLEEAGFEVFNPAENDLNNFGSLENVEAAYKEDADAALRKCLGEDLAWICAEADAIAMMPGWERSYGAKAEHATAVALKLQIIYLTDEDHV